MQRTDIARESLSRHILHTNYTVSRLRRHSPTHCHVSPQLGAPTEEEEVEEAGEAPWLHSVWQVSKRQMRGVWTYVSWGRIALLILKDRNRRLRSLTNAPLLEEKKYIFRKKVYIGKMYVYFCSLTYPREPWEVSESKYGVSTLPHMPRFSKYSWTDTSGGPACVAGILRICQWEQTDRIRESSHTTKWHRTTRDLRGGYFADCMISLDICDGWVYFRDSHPRATNKSINQVSLVTKERIAQS